MRVKLILVSDKDAQVRIRWLRQARQASLDCHSFGAYRRNGPSALRLLHENADSPHVSSVNSFERQMTLKEPGEGISENFEYPACPLCGSDRCEFPFRLRLEGDY